MQRNFDDMHGAARLLWPMVAVLALTVMALAPKPAHGAASQCTMIVPHGGREVMINTCDACRSVDIMRKRPGNDVPVQRTFTLPPGSRLQVPFLGPGRSRITSEVPCPGRPGAPPNIVKTPDLIRQKQPEACVALQRVANGVALLNQCGSCRAALIERVNGPNGGNARQAYKLGAHSVVAVPSDGFAQVGLIGDIACP